MDNIGMLKQIIKNGLESMDVHVEDSFIVIEESKEKSHGDYATNVAMKLASQLKKSPNLIAKDLIENMDKSNFDKIEIAGPGFINFFMKVESLTNVIDKILDEGENFGNGAPKNKTVNIEYVSANPTGDLHIGHARGAAIGDSLSRILKKAGYNVIREYYINDAGAQIDNLGKSLKSRYLELFGISYPIPEDGYQGEDVKEIAKKLKEEFGDKFTKNYDSDDDLQFFKDYGKALELEKIKKDLKEFRVEFDVFTSELDVRKNDSIPHLLEKQKDHIYEQDGALFLKTTDYLDDKDRVIVKSDGSYTYFLPDIVYHLDKLSRNADSLIDVLGADHHGYINRMKSALMMNGYSENALDIVLIQMVRIMKGGEEVKVSKRTGNALKLRDLSYEVGTDACRYFFAERASTSHLDFNLDLALERNSSNPVYYAQYAYARIQTVLTLSEIEPNKHYELLTNDDELSIMKCLNEYAKIIEQSANEKAPYKICNYIQKLATLIHSFYAKYRIIDKDNSELTGARLSLMKACSIVLKDSLNLIGVDAPDKM